MSLASYWRRRAEWVDTLFGDRVHIVITHKNYAFPGGVLACSVFPLVASEVLSWRIQANFKEPRNCDRCVWFLQWLQTHAIIKQIVKDPFLV